jgi:small subunit ribosomal protein S14
MAKTNMIEREKRRAKVVKKYAVRRAQIKEQIRDPKASQEERMAAIESLQKLPRDSRPSRKRNRCAITGRSRGNYRKFGLGRVKLREATMRGDVPGLRKASW